MEPTGKYLAGPETPPKKAGEPAHQSGQSSPYWGFTPNQVVAYNLARAREMKGWSQDQAAAILEPHLGVRWSKASFSQAERSVGGKFIRNFTADEIVAFARAFGLPVAWFFMPPPPETGAGTVSGPDTLDGRESRTDLTHLVDLVFGEEEGQAYLDLRLNSFLSQVGLRRLTAAQQRIANLVAARVAAVARRSIADLHDWQVALRSIADQLEDLEGRAKSGIEADPDLTGPFEPEIDAIDEVVVGGVEASPQGVDPDDTHWHTAVRSIAGQIEDLRARARKPAEPDVWFEETRR